MAESVDQLTKPDVVENLWLIGLNPFLNQGRVLFFSRSFTYFRC